MEHYEEYVSDFDLGDVVHFQYTPEGLPPVDIEAVPMENVGLIYSEFDDSEEFIPEGNPSAPITPEVREEAQKDLNEWLIEEKKEELLSRDEMAAFVKSTKNVNTTKKTEQIITAFQKYLSEFCYEERPIHTIDPDELDNFLANYILNKKDSKGHDHQPDTLTAIHRGILRHLREKEYEFDPLHGEEFKMSRQVLQAKRTTLKQAGLGNKPNKAEAFDDSQIEKMWVTGALGSSSPDSIQNTLYYFLNVGLGLRGSHEARQMLWGDICLQQDDDESLFLEWNERASKTRNGGEGGHVRSFAPKVYEVSDKSRCPIVFYKEFAKRRPEESLKPSSPFYLTVKQGATSESTVGYTKAPMGVNMLRGVVKKLAIKAGLKGKFTNHSLRKTCCQKLMAANVPPVLVAQLSGHKCLASLNNYTEATRGQQKAMSKVLTGKKRSSEVLQATSNPLSEIENAAPTPEGSSPGLRQSVTNMAAGSPPPAQIQRLSESAAGMFQGAVIHGNISLNIHYNVSNQSQSNMSLSPRVKQHCIE